MNIAQSFEIEKRMHYISSMRPILDKKALFSDTTSSFVTPTEPDPGDTVQITGGKLYVNGEEVPNPEFMGSVPMDYPKRRLGNDQYFVIGDNRYSSHDSRADDVGPISASAIMGKVEYVLLPWANHRGVE